MGVRFVTRLVRLPWHPRAARMLLAVISLILAALIAVGCWIDGTLYSTKGFVGLFWHGGYWAMFATTPFIIFFTGRLVDEFSEAIQNTHSYCTDEYQLRVAGAGTMSPSASQISRTILANILDHHRLRRLLDIQFR